jgi:hypothetical protein
MLDLPFKNKFCSKMYGYSCSQALRGNFFDGGERLQNEKITQ